MKLYEISNELRELKQLVEDGDFTAGQVADTLDALNITFEQKLMNCLYALKQIESPLPAINAEIDRLAKLKFAAERDAEKLTEYVRTNMEACEKDKLDLGLFKLTLKKASKQLGAIDETKVPDTFFTVIPESKKLDKRALLAAAKESQIEGVEVVDGKRALLIR